MFALVVPLEHWLLKKVYKKVYFFENFYSVTPNKNVIGMYNLLFQAFSE